MITAQDALAEAVNAAKRSPCAKSKRGVVIWRPSGTILAAEPNAPTFGYHCDGSPACRASCGRICIHAEQAALLDAATYGKGVVGAEMLHVKVVDGKPVPSGPPSCVDCSKLLLRSSLGGMWLYHDTGLRRYTAREFHDETLRILRLPPYHMDPAGLNAPGGSDP